MIIHKRFIKAFAQVQTKRVSLITSFHLSKAHLMVEVYAISRSYAVCICEINADFSSNPHSIYLSIYLSA